ncbi:hypothetical protein CH293_26315 [Rhodococcus sp. 14-2470-1b]|nr:hypothetical protein CH293_26315 [Rhodococcus sp. 14-2470-1b]
MFVVAMPVGVSIALYYRCLRLRSSLRATPQLGKSQRFTTLEPHHMVRNMPESDNDGMMARSWGGLEAALRSELLIGEA